MGQPVYFGGTIPLKPGTTPAQIISIYNEQTSSDLDPDDLYPAHFDPDNTRAISDGDDEIQFFFSQDQVEYSVDSSNMSYSFADDFEDFLKQVATDHSAGGWTSYEGHADTGQALVEYGPTPVARAFEAVRRINETIIHHQAELTKALIRLAEETTPAPA